MNEKRFIYYPFTQAIKDRKTRWDYEGNQNTSDFFNELYDKIVELEKQNQQLVLDIEILEKELWCKNCKNNNNRLLELKDNFINNYIDNKKEAYTIINLRIQNYDDFWEEKIFNLFKFKD